MIADAVKNTSLMIYNSETGFPLTKKLILTKQMFTDKDGNLWVSSERGFARIDLHQHFYDYEPAGLNFQTEITGVFKDATSTNSK